MKQAVLLIDCYLYGTIAILAVVLLVLVYLHGQANHLPNPFVRKNIIYRPAPKARGVLLGQKYGLLAYSPERDEGHIIVMGPSGHWQDKCPADSDTADLAGHCPCRGYIRRHIRQCGRAKQNHF